jgi:Double zinc ribbon
MMRKLAILCALFLAFTVSHAAARDTERREPVAMTVGPPSSLYSVDGLALGVKVALGSAAYRQYQCARSEKFEGFVWCTKTSNDREARGPFKVWFSMLHAQNGIAVYVNRYQEPAHWGANAIPEDIQRYSKKIGEQPHLVQLPTRPGAPRGTIATWGKVVLEPITGDELRGLAEGKPLGEGIALDFIGDFARSARQGLPVYRLAGGAGFVWAASYDEKGRGTLRFSAVDASAYSPQTLPPPVTTPAPVAAVAPDEKAAAVDPSSSLPQALPPPETTPPPVAVPPPGAVATAVDPSSSSPQTLPPRETTPPAVTPLPPVATAAGSNEEETVQLGGTEPEPTNPKLDVGVGQVGAYVCRLVGSVGAIYLQQRFCADPVRVSYFVFVLIGLALVSGVAMVRLAPALKGNSPSTTLLPSEPSIDASKPVKRLLAPQSPSVIVPADQKVNAGEGGGFVASAGVFQNTSSLFKPTMTDQRNNSSEVTPSCWACGENINATDRFCSACGAPKKLYSQVKCQTCSAELPSDAAFCPKCGSKVTDALPVLTTTKQSFEIN